MISTLSVLLLAGCGGSPPTVEVGPDIVPPSEDTVADSPADTDVVIDTDVVVLPECPELVGMRWRTERRLDGEWIPFGPGDPFYFGVDGNPKALVAAFDLTSPPDPGTRTGRGRVDLFRDDGRLFASTVLNYELPYYNLAIHHLDGAAIHQALYDRGLTGPTTTELNVDRAWVDGTAAVFHVEFEVPTICRSVQDIPVILRVNSFAEGRPYPIVWLDREAAPGTRPPPEAPEPPVEHGAGADSGPP